MRHGHRLRRIMKNRLAPTQISLKELAPEGREFDFTQESGELNAVLKDLIGNNPYDIHLKITPTGNSFDLKGHIRTAMDLQCSVCADEFKSKIRLNLHELIVITQAFGKGDQHTKANHAHEWESKGPDYILLETDHFSVGEYAHEAIALAEPIRPLCAPDQPGGCAHADQRIDRPWLSYGEEEKPGTEIRANPFQVLEKIKLKS